MRSKRLRPCFALVVGSALLLTSCNESGQPSPPPARPITFIPVMAPPGSPVLKKGSMSRQEQAILEESFQRISIVDHELSAEIAQSTDWKEADRKVRTDLDALTENPYLYHLIQTTGNQMLSDQLLRGSIDGEKKAAISFYTQLLLDNNHPDAMILSRALEALEGEWPPERRADAAQRASRFASEYLALNPCEACAGDVTVVEQIQDAKQRRLFEISNSLPRLRKMAGEIKK